MLLSRKFTEASDVYSFGIVIGEVYSQAELPYSNLDDEQLIAYLTKTFRQKNNCSDTEATVLVDPPVSCQDSVVRDVMKACVDVNDYRRPEFAKISALLSPMVPSTLLDGAVFVSDTHSTGESRL